MIREPVVAGQFYPDDKEELEKMIKFCNDHEYGPGSQFKESDEKIFGIVCPHAGYAYSVLQRAMLTSPFQRRIQNLQ